VNVCTFALNETVAIDAIALFFSVGLSVCPTFFLALSLSTSFCLFVSFLLSHIVTRKKKKEFRLSYILYKFSFFRFRSDQDESRCSNRIVDIGSLLLNSCLFSLIVARSPWYLRAKMTCCQRISFAHSVNTMTTVRRSIESRRRE
jgi:hypothetical protein